MENRLGALFALIDYSDVPIDEFNAWYDTEHIPERLDLPGFIGAGRWLATDSNLSLVSYDLEALGVLAGDGYRGVAGENFSPWSRRVLGMSSWFGRYEAVQISPGDRVAPEGAQGLFFVAMNVEPSIEDEFNRWYETEHLPRLAALDGVIAARRFRAEVGPQRYAAVYHLEDPGIVGSPPWLEAAETEWTHRIRPHTSDRLKVICRPYEPQAG